VCAVMVIDSPLGVMIFYASLARLQNGDHESETHEFTIIK